MAMATTPLVLDKDISNTHSHSAMYACVTVCMCVWQPQYEEPTSFPFMVVKLKDILLVPRWMNAFATPASINQSPDTDTIPASLRNPHRSHKDPRRPPCCPSCGGRSNN